MEGTCVFQDVSKPLVLILMRVRSKSFRVVSRLIIGGLTWYHDDETFLSDSFGRRHMADTPNRGGILLCR